jgi:hypothetical protein
VDLKRKSGYEITKRKVVLMTFLCSYFVTFSGGRETIFLLNPKDENKKDMFCDQIPISFCRHFPGSGYVPRREKQSFLKRAVAVTKYPDRNPIDK